MRFLSYVTVFYFLLVLLQQDLPRKMIQALAKKG